MTNTCFPMAKDAHLPRLARFCTGLLLASLLVTPAIAQSPASNTAEPSLAPSRTIPAPNPPDTRPVSPALEEMRGMWVVRDGLESPQAVHQVVVTAVKYHLNALFVQVRGRGDAWYRSSFEPRAEGLRGQPESFDPLEQIVAEAHANGIEVHAWLNTFLTWSGSRPPSSPEHLWNAHRDWFTQDNHGRCSPIGTNASEGAFLQPSNPAVQQHLLNVYTEVARNYDVDGIHFDYCRYCGSEFDFSPGTVARFRAYLIEKLTPEQVALFDARLPGDHFAYIHAFHKQWETWRRDQVTTVVSRISAAVKAEKPWMQVSAAVFADAHDAFTERGQDWAGWLQSGYLDAVALMSYATDTNRVLEQTRHAVAIAGDKHVYTGIGAWRMQAHDVADKISQIRQTGAAGVNLFSYNSVHTRDHYLETLSRGVFSSRAAPPRMKWLPDRKKSDAKPSRSAPPLRKNDG